MKNNNNVVNPVLVVSVQTGNNLPCTMEFPLMDEEMGADNFKRIMDWRPDHFLVLLTSSTVLVINPDHLIEILFKIVISPVSTAFPIMREGETIFVMAKDIDNTNKFIRRMEWYNPDHLLETTHYFAHAQTNGNNPSKSIHVPTLISDEGELFPEDISMLVINSWEINKLYRSLFEAPKGLGRENEWDMVRIYIGALEDLSDEDDGFEGFDDMLEDMQEY